MNDPHPAPSYSRIHASRCGMAMGRMPSDETALMAWVAGDVEPRAPRTPSPHGRSK